MQNQRKSYIVAIKPELGEQLQQVANEKGLPYQVFARMLLRKGLQELNRKHKKED